MWKKIKLIGLGLILTSGVLLYHFVLRDEARLQRLGYSNTEISQLMKLDNHLVQKLLSFDHRSDHIFEFLNVPLFNYNLYDEYVQFANENPQLTTEEVVSTVSFLNHIFIPTLLQSGYAEETIEIWNQSEQFSQYLAEADLVSLNNLLGFARRSGSELDVLHKYVDYEKRSPHLEIEEVIEYVNFYKTTVLPQLKARGYSTEDIELIYQELSISQFKYLLDTNLSATQTLELIAANGFNPEYFAIYEEILNDNLDRGATYAVQFAKHSNVKGNFYENIVQTPNQGSLLALVNRNFRLSYDYRPNNFSRVEVPISEFTKINSNFLRAEAARATEELFASALEAGHQLILRRGFISFETQQQLYSQTTPEMITEYGISKTPRAGHSEHQTGLAIAVTTPEMGETLTPDFASTAAGQWVLQNAHQFGFIIRYPEGRESETGMPYQPYHLRYVGIDVATEIFENDWILEDYILIHAIFDQETEAIEDSTMVSGIDEESELEESGSESDEVEVDSEDENELNTESNEGSHGDSEDDLISETSDEQNENPNIPELELDDDSSDELPQIDFL